MFLDGVGMRKNPKRALLLLRRAARKGLHAFKTDAVTFASEGPLCSPGPGACADVVCACQANGARGALSGAEASVLMSRWNHPTYEELEAVDTLLERWKKKRYRGNDFPFPASQ